MEVFVKKFPSWWGRVCSKDPVYALPDQVVRALAHADFSPDSDRRLSEPSISDEDAQAELEFARGCRNLSPDAVGAWDGQAVIYPWLAERRDHLDELERLVGEMNWEVKNAADQIMQLVGGSSSSLKLAQGILLGYAGRLTFNKQYRGEMEVLRERWVGVPDRPPFPLYANMDDPPSDPLRAFDPSVDRKLKGELERFVVDVGRFMRKWRLNRMVTWDLPMPQGQLELVPLGLQAKVLGRDAPVTTTPSYYDSLSGIGVTQLVPIRIEVESDRRGSLPSRCSSSPRTS